MGHWTTLHLFDDEIFYKQVIPTLCGKQGNLETDYLDFLKLHLIGGILQFSDEELNILLKQSVHRVIEISNEFDKSFKWHNEFHKIQNYEKERLFLDQYDGHYDFGKFFEYYIFKTCADFFPHIPLGKYGLSNKFALNPKTLSYSFMCEFNNWNSFFCADMMGITNWVTKEDVELLYLDKENLQSENIEFLNTFLNFLEVAFEKKFGLVMGVDMREDRLELLPNNKLVKSSYWDSINKDGMLYKR